jgi:hypothetical protein
MRPPRRMARVLDGLGSERIPNESRTFRARTERIRRESGPPGVARSPPSSRFPAGFPLRSRAETACRAGALPTELNARTAESTSAIVRPGTVLCPSKRFSSDQRIEGLAARADAAGATFQLTACLFIYSRHRGDELITRLEDRRASEVILSGGTSFGSKGPLTGPFSVALGISRGARWADANDGARSGHRSTSAPTIRARMVEPAAAPATAVQKLPRAARSPQRS